MIDPGSSGYFLLPARAALRRVEGRDVLLFRVALFARRLSRQTKAVVGCHVLVGDGARGEWLRFVRFTPTCCSTRQACSIADGFDSRGLFSPHEIGCRVPGGGNRRVGEPSL
jgi:hypothetical protein